MNKAASNSSPKAKNLSARLMAVQGVYQAMQNGKGLHDIFEEYQLRKNPVDIDGEPLVAPDGTLLKKILLGVEERRADLDAMIKANYSKQDKGLEPLLQAILLCGAYELISPGEFDQPIIINDYLNVTHSFYEAGEVGLINGILDSIAKTTK
jgi:N utilization substance protein B